MINISLEEIKKRIGDDNEYLGYHGFDMTGYGGSIDDRSAVGNLENKLKNYVFLRKYFSEITNEISFDNFKLLAWKGVMWWGESKEDFDDALSGWGTAEIICYVIDMINLANIKNNKEYVYENPKKYISRIITREDRYKVLKRQRWSCNICSQRLKYNKRSDWEGEVAHIDHIFPFSKREDYSNGEENINESSNLQALCPECNLKKSKKVIQ